VTTVAERVVKRKSLTLKVIGILAAVLLFVAPIIAIAVKKGWVADAERHTIIPRWYWVTGPFGPDLAKAYEPENNPDPAKVYRNEAGEELKWKAIPVVNKVWCLDFKKLFKANNAVGYALVYVFSPKEQAGVMLLGSDDTITVWLNGEEVHDFPELRPGQPDQDRVPVRWRQGKNTVLIKVGNSKGDHLFFAKFVGEEIRASTNPE